MEKGEWVDSLSGMITRAQAAALETDNLRQELRRTLDAKSLISIPSAEPRQVHELSVEDRIYRIFNQTENSGAKRPQKHRMIVIGDEGKTVKVNLNGRTSEETDMIPLMIGDLIRIDNLIFDTATQTLYSTVASNIKIIKQSTEFPGSYCFRGVIESAEQSRLGPKDGLVIKVHDDSGTALVKIYDNHTLTIKEGDPILIEFCSIRERDGLREIFANHDSRILTPAFCISSRIQHTP